MIKVFFLILIIPFLLLGCKEKDEDDPSQIDEMVGTYYGETFFEYDGYLLMDSSEITKLNKDTLLMNYWRPTIGGPIKLFVTGNKIETLSQILPHIGHMNCPWHVYYMDFRVSIQGYYRNDSIHFTFQEEIKQEHDSVFRHYDSGRTELHKYMN